MTTKNDDDSIELHRSDSDKHDSSSNKSFDGSESTPLVERTGKVYKRRWLMLLIFSLNTAMNGCLFMAISPINNIVEKYYDVGSVGIEWLSNMCVVSYIFLALPATYFMGRWGIRPLVTLAAACNFLACCLHFAGYEHTRFYLVLLGQAFTSIAYSTIIQIPGKLSSLWFPHNERATATAIGVVMNMFGVGIGFLQPSVMVNASSDRKAVRDDLKTFYISQMVISGVIFLFTFLYREKPPTPPCTQVEDTAASSLTFIQSLKFLFNDRYFIFLSQSYAIYFALFVTIFILANPLITHKYKNVSNDIGWMGFVNNMVAVVSFVLIGRFLDKYKKFKLMAVLLNVSSLIMWLIFVLLLNYTTSFAALYAVYIIMGVAIIPFFSTGIETAAEMMYPVSEETSSSVMLVTGNVYAFAMIFGFGKLVALGFDGVVCYVIVGCYAISSVMAALTKVELKRP